MTPAGVHGREGRETQSKPAQILGMKRVDIFFGRDPVENFFFFEALGQAAARTLNQNSIDARISV